MPNELRSSRNRYVANNRQIEFDLAKSAVKSRHFKLANVGSKLVLKYLKLTDGDLQKSNVTVDCYGGSILIQNGVLRATSCWFYQNSACNGGAISIRNKEVQDLWTVSTFSLTNTNLTHNSATGDVAKQDVRYYVGGGAIYLNGYIGKSLWALGNLSRVQCSWNDVGQNSASNIGGAGGCILSEGMSELVVLQSTFKDNFGGTSKGGAIASISDTAAYPVSTLKDTNFIDNKVFKKIFLQVCCLLLEMVWLSQ